jgi:hypothetical protein
MRPDFWPNRQQELLLTAALADGETAIRAWQDWQSHEAIERADEGSARLMPLVYFNLTRLGLRDPSVVPLKEAFIRTRYANKLRLKRLEALLSLFESRDIPTLLLKGVALTLQVYRDPGLRPMADLDVAVPHRCAEQATAVLRDNGWSSPDLPPAVRVSPESIPTILFVAADGAEFDLHFSPFIESLSWPSVAPFWSAATPLRVGDANTSTLSATDHLLHTLAHGARVNWAVPPIRWVADAMWLLRGEAPIDWDRFVAQASALELALVTSRTLAYLKERHGADVPSDALDVLRRRPSALEAREYAWRRGLSLGGLVASVCYWARYARQYPERSLLARIAGFPIHMRARWTAPTMSGAAWIAFKKVALQCRRAWSRKSV